MAFTGPVVVTKNPCLHPGGRGLCSVGPVGVISLFSNVSDVRLLDAVIIPELKHLTNVIVFPTRGPRPHPSEISGSSPSPRFTQLCRPTACSLWQVGIWTGTSSLLAGTNLFCKFNPLMLSCQPKTSEDAHSPKEREKGRRPSGTFSSKACLTPVLVKYATLTKLTPNCLRKERRIQFV